MKTAKRVLLIVAATLMLISLSGCMTFSCDECRPPRPRRVRRPVVYRVVRPPAVAPF